MVVALEYLAAGLICSRPRRGRGLRVARPALARRGGGARGGCARARRRCSRSSTPRSRTPPLTRLPERALVHGLGRHGRLPRCSPGARASTGLVALVAPLSSLGVAAAVFSTAAGAGAGHVAARVAAARARAARERRTRAARTRRARPGFVSRRAPPPEAQAPARGGRARGPRSRRSTAQARSRSRRVPAAHARRGHGFALARADLGHVLLGQSPRDVLPDRVGDLRRARRGALGARQPARALRAHLDGGLRVPRHRRARRGVVRVKLLLVGMNHRTAPLDCVSASRSTTPGRCCASSSPATRSTRPCCSPPATASRWSCSRARSTPARLRLRSLFRRELGPTEGAARSASSTSCLYEYQNGDAMRHVLRVASSLDSMVRGRAADPRPGQGRLSRRRGVRRGGSDPGPPVPARIRHREARAQRDAHRGAARLGRARGGRPRRADLRGVRREARAARRSRRDDRARAARAARRGARGDRASRIAPPSAPRVSRSSSAPPRTASTSCRRCSPTPTSCSRRSAAASRGSRAPVAERALRARRGRPMFVIDIGVPRNADPAIDAHRRRLPLRPRRPRRRSRTRTRRSGGASRRAPR